MSAASKLMPLRALFSSNAWRAGSSLRFLDQPLDAAAFTLKHCFGLSLGAVYFTRWNFSMQRTQ
eukprot:558423-Lingulodinium_polyedra.AAC.1